MRFAGARFLRRGGISGSLLFITTNAGCPFCRKVPEEYLTGHRLQKNMSTTTNDEVSVYEVGYLVVSSIPEEKVPGEAEAVKKIITDAGSTVITEEAPHHEHLAYTISKKTVSGGYEKYDHAYFGWIKFELGSDKIEAVKKAIELRPAVLRMLLISTVRENTYLGKRAPALNTVAFAPIAVATISGALTDDKKDAAPATIEEMDKSIDNMVKEV